MREQPIGEAVFDDDFVPEGLTWPPVKEIDVSEVHQSLVKAVAGSRGVEFFTTYVSDAAMACQLGRVQLAIDHTAGEACGIFLTHRIVDADPATGDPIFVDEATEPFKFRYFDDVEAAVWAYSEHLKKAEIHPRIQP